MRFDHESEEDWYERAIVAHSMAAAHEEELAEAGSLNARRIACNRAEDKAADLAQALAAVHAARRATPHTTPATTPANPPPMTPPREKWNHPPVETSRSGGTSQSPQTAVRLAG